MKHFVALSLASNRFMMTVSTPAFLKARCRPYMPSEVTSPCPEWQDARQAIDVLDRSHRETSLADNSPKREDKEPPDITKPDKDMASL